MPKFIDTPGFTSYQREFVKQQVNRKNFSRSVPFRLATFLITASASALLYAHATHPRIPGFIREGGPAWLMNLMIAGVVAAVIIRFSLSVLTFFATWMARDYNKDTRKTKELHGMILGILPAFRENALDRLQEGIFWIGHWIFVIALLADGWFGTAGFHIVSLWAGRKAIQEFVEECITHIKGLTQQQIMDWQMPIDVECRELRDGERAGEPITVQGIVYHRVK